MNKACPEPPWPPEPSSPSEYPKKLAAIVALFEGLPEDEKRETLVSYADQASRWAPAPESGPYDLEDVRKDEECTDTVGIFLKVEPSRQIHFRVSLGPQVQILTRAMTSILCQGLESSTIEQVIDVPADFVPRIVGGQLVRVRSQTVYYVLTRMKSACRAFLNRERAAAQ
jgi:cysteine desulfuration protein SufE